MWRTPPAWPPTNADAPASATHGTDRSADRLSITSRLSTDCGSGRIMRSVSRRSAAPARRHGVLLARRLGILICAVSQQHLHTG